VLAIGVVLVGAFLLGIPSIANYYAGLFFAFLGGVGMGAQDTVCPVLLSTAFKKNYEGSLSAGQAMFGLGSFTTPFLVGLLLSNNQPFYFAFYILLLVPVIMLICMPFAKMDMQEHEESKAESVKPLYGKNVILAYATILIVCAAYCAAVNTIGMYTSSFAESMGISSSSSAYMLTIYNVGCFLGSLAFILVLRKVKTQKVLIINNVCAALALLIALFINKAAVYFVGVFIAGFFLGVLFSVIVAIATRIGYKRISIAGSLVAIVGGASDILTPIITGFLVKKVGVGFSFWYAVIMIIITLIASGVLMVNTTEKEYA
jgi:fucose permease